MKPDIVIDLERSPRKPNATYYGTLKFFDLRNKRTPMYGFDGRAWQPDDADLGPDKWFFLPVRALRDDANVFIVDRRSLVIKD